MKGGREERDEGVKRGRGERDEGGKGGRGERDEGDDFNEGVVVPITLGRKRFINVCVCVCV